MRLLDLMGTVEQEPRDLLSLVTKVVVGGGPGTLMAIMKAVESIVGG